MEIISAALDLHLDLTNPIDASHSETWQLYDTFFQIRFKSI